MPKVLDLFTGCGGFALGAKNAGFDVAMAIDNDPILTSSFARNFNGDRLKLGDLARIDPLSLRDALRSSVDGVIGGPPCQAFSEIGKRNGADPRRSLIGTFFRIVSTLRPTFFVMENVRGLGFDGNRELLRAGLDLLSGRWNVVGPIILDAADFGAPTRRRRLFVIGLNCERSDAMSVEDFVGDPGKTATVRDAIADLSGARELALDDDGYDRWRYDTKSRYSDYAKSMRSPNGIFTGNRRTEHRRATVRRFSKIAPGGNDAVGKYPRLAWDALCPAIRAGTGEDHGSFQSVRPIHPRQDRVITVREAARLQGFPDEFVFHPTIWHSFRMIGNSVSPIIAAAILGRIRGRISSETAGRVVAAE